MTNKGHMKDHTAIGFVCSRAAVLSIAGLLTATTVLAQTQSSPPAAQQQPSATQQQAPAAQDGRPGSSSTGSGGMPMRGMEHGDQMRQRGMEHDRGGTHGPRMMEQQKK